MPVTNCHSNLYRETTLFSLLSKSLNKREVTKHISCSSSFSAESPGREDLLQRSLFAKKAPCKKACSHHLVEGKFHNSVFLRTKHIAATEQAYKEIL